MFDKIFEKFKRFLKALFNRVQISTSKRSQLEYWVPGHYFFFPIFILNDLTPAHIHEIFFKIQIPCMYLLLYLLHSAGKSPFEDFSLFKIDSNDTPNVLSSCPFCSILGIPFILCFPFVSCTSLTSTGGREFAKKNQKVPLV